MKNENTMTWWDKPPAAWLAVLAAVVASRRVRDRWLFEDWSGFTVSVFDKEMKEADKGHGSQLSSASGRGGWRVIAGGRGYVLESERREWWFVCLNYSELQGFCVLNQNSWLIFCFSLKMKLLVAQRLDYQLITDYKKNWNKNFKKTFILHSSTFVIQWWCHFYYIFIFHLIYMKRPLGLGPVGVCEGSNLSPHKSMVIVNIYKLFFFMKCEWRRNFICEVICLMGT